MYNRYEISKVDKNGPVGDNYYANVVYPDILYSENDSYIITTMGDRLDLLALDFYNDDSLWWIIVSANNLPGDTIYAPIGVQLRIPINVQGIINNYRTVNVNR